MVALHGWMLARMSPCDLDAFLEGATATVGTCNRLTGSMLLHLWAMAFLKWPKCVTQWASVVSDAAGRPGVSAGSLDVQAEFFASRSVELACHCDMEKHLAAGGSSGSNPLFGVVLELVYGPCGAPSPWSNERPPLGPSGGSPLVHQMAPPSFNPPLDRAFKRGRSS